jgi:DNA-binding response OmpR family regulator
MSQRPTVPPRVLVIDDDPRVLQMLYDVLINARYDV